MRNKLVLLLLGVFVLLSSCKTEKKIVTEKKIDTDILTPKLYEIVAKEVYGGKEERSNTIIKNKEDLEALNQEILLNKLKVKLDFKKSNLVVLFMGQKNSGGYLIDVGEVTEGEDAVYIKVKETTPEEGEQSIMIQTRPYCIVKINSKKEIIVDTNDYTEMGSFF